METFADVLHAIIDTVFTGDAADKAHGIIDSASGTRSEAAAAEAEAAPEASQAEPATTDHDTAEDAPPPPTA